MVANRIARDETRLTPLEIMCENMWFWWDEVQRVGRQVSEFVVDMENPASRRKAAALLARWNNARAHAQECALDAAPYMHRRLASISVEPPPPELPEFTMEMPKQIKGEDRSYREGPPAKKESMH